MSKLTLCPGPGAVIPEWINSQKEYFGRGDNEYKKLKKETLRWLCKVSAKDNIVPVPGAATTAGYLSFVNFLENKILVINTGYYSLRWKNLAKELFPSKNLYFCEYEDIESYKRKVDWIVFVYVETSECKNFDIKKVKKKKKKLGAKLLVDATASIGLEKNHNIADVMFFSSCKGLLGPTGLGFIGYNNKIKINKPKNFYTDLNTHKNSMYTLGYNCMCALNQIAKKHGEYVKKIRFTRNLILKYSLNKPNPIIGLDLNFKIKNKKKFKNVIFYQPRGKKANQLVFFLGFIKYTNQEIKKIVKKVFLASLK